MGPTSLTIAILVVAGVGWLLWRNWKKRGLLDRMARDRGWHVDRKKVRRLPARLESETLPSLHTSDDYRLSVYLQLEGTHRGRSFYLLSRQQRRRRRGIVGDGSFLFTKLGETREYPPLMVLPASSAMEALHRVDEWLAASNNELALPQVPISALFDASYLVRGLSGSQEFLTPERQRAILENPEMFQRSDETWHTRHVVIPCLSETYAYLEFPTVDPDTILNRLEMLMDWADIIES